MAERDGFERYYEEKLWLRIPAVYRHEDGIAPTPGVLRAVVRLLARQAARLRRSQDRLWDDQFIELCDSWSVPYVGDLVATRLVSALNQRSRRADVAKTIHYRRRSGTLGLLEELIPDVTGWEGTVVEMFRRLARTPHRLDEEPAAHAGRWSGTLPGGLPNLRRTGAVELVGGPFDEFHHTPDVRRADGGVRGRHSIPKLAFHLYRLAAYSVVGVTSRTISGGRFTFDPSGRSIPLFVKANRRAGDARPGASEWRRPREWELPGPMRCRLLGDARYRVDEPLIEALETPKGPLSAAAADGLRRIAGIEFPSEPSFRRQLQAAPALWNELGTVANYRLVIAGALVEACGKWQLLPWKDPAPPGNWTPRAVTVFDGPAPAPPVPPEQTTAGDLTQGLPTTVQTEKHLAIDPEHGLFGFITAGPAKPPPVDYVYGFAGPVGAGTYDRSDVIRGLAPTPAHATGGGQLTPGGAAVTVIDDSATYTPVVDVTGIITMVLVAADAQRPYLQLANDWKLDSSANQGSSLVLDGLWIGGANVILKGDWAAVTLRHCTLDPGGATADQQPIHSVRLLVEGTVQQLVIEASIAGSILVQSGGKVEKLALADAVVQADATVPAIGLPEGLLELRRVTVLGDLAVHRLDASEALVAGSVTVVDPQAGCFRFSAARAGSTLPHAYRSTALAETAPLFRSRAFGDPEYVQLSAAALAPLRTGAENGSEIGAFSALIRPIKQDGLLAKVNEFLPFGLIPVFIAET